MSIRSQKAPAAYGLSPSRASSPAPSGPSGAPARRRGTKLWAVAASAAAVLAGALIGTIWMPLGFLVGAFVGAVLAGPAEAAVGVIGTAVGVPLLRSVLSDIIHSPLYLGAAAIGLALGLVLRSALVAGLRRGH